MQKYESGQATRTEIYQISECYRYGTGVNADSDKAAEFLIKAIELLYVPAMEHVDPYLISVKLAKHVVSKFTPVNTTDYNAVRPFVEFIAKKQKNPVAMLYVGYSYAQQGNWDEAKTWFRKLSLVAHERHSDRGGRLTLAVDEHQKRLAGTIPHGHTQYPKLKNLFTSLDAGILNFEAQETEKLFSTYSKVRESLKKSWD